MNEDRLLELVDEIFERLQEKLDEEKQSLLEDLVDQLEMQ